MKPASARTIRSSIDKVRSGDLGSLPVVVGLVIIWTVFGTLNPTFLSSNNLANLLFDASTVGVISLGIVCVLMVGEIDLSVGSISGFASAMVGMLWVNQGWPVGRCHYRRRPCGRIDRIALCAALQSPWNAELRFDAGRSAGGARNAALSARCDRLDQLALWLGDRELRPAIGHPASARLLLCAAARRRDAGLRAIVPPSAAGKANLSSRSIGGLVARAVAITVALEFVAFYLNQDRGIPWMFALFVALVIVMNYALTRTQWGRSMAAVGGNREAARRAGINVRRIYTSAFVLCAMFAALGGVLAAARLASASQQAGTGDVNLNAIAAAVIGGTSLFGGRGSAYSALLGIIVIQSIASGLTMLDLSSALRYMITGAVLAIAVIVDSLARRSRVSHGRA